MKHFLRLALFAAALAFPSAADAANRFLTCTVTCTITAVDTTIWGTTSGGTGASVPGSSDAVILDAATCVGGVTCTATMGAGYNPTWGSITMGACTASTSGCILDFSANNNNVTISGTFNCNGTGTRTLNMGSGTWTMTQGGGSTPWDLGVVTNLTFNANTSTILFSATTVTGNRVFAGGGRTYSTVTLASPSVISGNIVFSITGANTFGTFNINPPYWVRFPAGTTTITSAFNWTGTAFNNAIAIDGGTGSAATISSANNGTLTWGVVSGLTFTGGGTFTATNSFDMKANTGITITGPATGSGGGIIGG